MFGFLKNIPAQLVKGVRSSIEGEVRRLQGIEPLGLRCRAWRSYSGGSSWQDGAPTLGQVAQLGDIGVTIEDDAGRLWFLAKE